MLEHHMLPQQEHQMLPEAACDQLITHQDHRLALGEDSRGSAASSSAGGSSAANAAKGRCCKHQDKTQAKTHQDKTRNGASTPRYFWSQDTKEVVVSILVAPNTRAKQVKAVVKDGVLTVEVEGDKVLDNLLAYPITVPEDTQLDWQVADQSQDQSGRRVVEVTLTKALPGAESLAALPRSDAVIIWWKCVFKGDCEIDLLAIPDRKGGKDALASHQQVWKEAHQMFKEKVKNQQPMII
mmetsp:Transcript_67254/g.109039  ORF Transcript_67254/g.109039 Transcript_67254/m.109039 type:complete len:239 (+) Transcript_67254:116-832(+)